MKKRFLKLSCFATVLLILLIIPCTTLAASQEKAAEYTQFICKNLITGEETYQYFKTTPPPELRGNILVTEGIKGTSTITDSDFITPKDIIGTDDRTEVPSYTSKPYRCIAYLETRWPDGTVSSGTAWLFKADSACTAGHLVYSSRHGGFATSITIWPGRRNSSQPYGSAYMIGYGIPGAYVQNEDIKYDYALIKLNTSIGSQTGTLTYVYGYGSVGLDVTISGYPGDKLITQWRSSGTINVLTDYIFRYNNDTEDGQSGSPIYVGIFSYVYGIHTRGYQYYNEGNRITYDMYSFMNSF